MRYERVEDRDELEALNQLLLRKLYAASSRPQRQKLGYRSGHMFVEAFWVPSAGFWFAIRMKRDHVWIGLGLEELNTKKALHIVVEINTPKVAKHGRAGIFLRAGKVATLAHSGRVGGGRPHINKTNFLRFYQAKRGSIAEYEDGSPAILLGHLNGKELVGRIGRFVRSVADFKRSEPGDSAFIPEKRKGKLFRPKFSGTIRYRTTGTVSAELIHELVALALEKRIGKSCLYTLHNDLFIPDRSKRPIVLFEIKTDADPTSIYKGVGQLLVNGHAESTLPKLVLVLPGSPSAATESVLRKLKIQILTYIWKNRVAHFPRTLPSFA